jgi:hypothetical protein
LDKEDIERFWSKVNKTETCWNWTAAIRGNSGYGAFKLKGRVISAHRVSYELAFGAIDREACVLHKCDNKLCVKPNDLFLGSKEDNVKDMDAKGRRGIYKHYCEMRCIICNKIFQRTYYVALGEEKYCCTRSCGIKLHWKLRRGELSEADCIKLKEASIIKIVQTKGKYNA